MKMKQTSFLHQRSSQPILSPLQRNKKSSLTQENLLQMRDSSCAYWFQVGDIVRVVDDVYKRGNINLKGKIGKVIETWEKCEVDPTCCCAEQVDLGMAVHVRFQQTLNEGPENEKNSLFVQDFFVHYFAEEELIKVKNNDMNTELAKKKKEEPELLAKIEKDIGIISDANVVAFDGLYCTQFKLQQLELDGRPRKIASYEPTSLEEK